MEFNTLFFIIFFLPLSLLIYYFVPLKRKNTVMLTISSIYCGFISIYLLIAVYILITINYFAGIYMSKNSGNSFKQKMVYATILLADIILFFVLRSKNVLSVIMPMYSQNVFMPICVSFFMIHFTGYITDVYKKRIFAEKSYKSFALYILFFPKFILGPLVRYSDFYPYMKRTKINLSIMGKGLLIFIKGLFKNVIIGGSVYQLYSAVNTISLNNLSALSAWLGILAFSFSFYFCLSGFLDMARGLSYCFGYKFAKDFEHPFFASGVGEFFSKWHISTVKWFETYMSAPMKSNKNKYTEVFSTILIWLIIGLWYEVSLNKIVWGLIIGIAIAVEKVFRKNNGFSYISVIYTFVITSIGWILFSQNSMTDSFMFLKALIGGNNIIADELSFYLFKSYIVILLIAVYASTDLFKNLVEKVREKEIFSIPCNAIMPVIDMFCLIVSIAVITAEGTRESLSVMFG